ncbi:unnamed protein product [Toxocara canis]|uniref:Nucleoporin Nup54 alpha-helical domain-containing protein n=1 Tax=Toxocara canis TaxID=6265 RepID=A0A183UF67_TOXCA|nr:unnamed protein product [Toxocara canis]
MASPCCGGNGGCCGGQFRGFNPGFGGSTIIISPNALSNTDSTASNIISPQLSSLGNNNPFEAGAFSSMPNTASLFNGQLVSNPFGITLNSFTPFGSSNPVSTPSAMLSATFIFISLIAQVNGQPIKDDRRQPSSTSQYSSVDWHPSTLAQRVDGRSSDRSQSSAGFLASRSKRFIQPAIPLIEPYSGGLAFPLTEMYSSGLSFPLTETYSGGLSFPLTEMYSGGLSFPLTETYSGGLALPLKQVHAGELLTRAAPALTGTTSLVSRPYTAIPYVPTTLHLPNEPDNCKPSLLDLLDVPQLPEVPERQDSAKESIDERMLRKITERINQMLRNAETFVDLKKKLWRLRHCKNVLELPKLPEIPLPVDSGEISDETRQRIKEYNEVAKSFNEALGYYEKIKVLEHFLKGGH